MILKELLQSMHVMALLMLSSIQSIGFNHKFMMVISNFILKLGRFGIVVSADIAVYPKGPARPTGGVGAIAMLIGPNAPLVVDPVRSSFMDDAYDFYKPVPSNSY